jgi:hypothetical protein
MAQYEDLELDQGSDAKWEVKLLSPDGTPRDISGYTLRGVVNRSYAADSSEMMEFTTRALVPLSAGVFEFYLTNDQTELMSRRRYVYDLEVSYIDSDTADDLNITERVLEGNLMVSRSVSKFD